MGAYDKLKNMSDEQLLEYCVDSHLYTHFAAENGFPDAAINLCAHALMGRIKAYKASLEAREQAIKRYELLRTLKPIQFFDIYQRNIVMGEPFDEIIDELLEERMIK